MDPISNKNSISTSFSRNFICLLSKWYMNSDVSRRIYLNALLCLILYLFTFWIPATKTAPLWMSLLYLAWGVMRDASKAYTALSATALGKAFLGIAFSVCVCFSVGFSAQLVNHVAGADPLKFPRTIALFSISLIPVFVVALLSVLYFALVLFIPFIGMFFGVFDVNFRKVIFPGYEPSKRLTGFDVLLRVAAFIIISCTCQAFMGTIIPRYLNNIEHSCAWFLYNFETYESFPCKENSIERAAFLDDGKVDVVRWRNGILQYQVRECVVKETSGKP